MQSFRAAIVQMRSGRDLEANRRKMAAAVAKAADEGADLVCLPEVVAWRGAKADEGKHAELITGPTCQFIAGLAREHRMWVVGGSFLERPDDDEASGRSFNTCPLFDRSGTLLAAYRKIHLFDIDGAGEVSVRESDTRRAGSEIVCVDTEFGRIGLAVCYDLRFAELFGALSRAGAEIIIVPSAFTAPTGRAHWHVLTRARAIENQCFILAPNQYGRGEADFGEYGHSIAIDPWGRVLGEAGEDGDEVVIVDLDAGVLEKTRRQLPSLQHRRLDTKSFLLKEMTR